MNNRLLQPFDLVAKLRRDIEADFETMTANRRKYCGVEDRKPGIIEKLFTDIGFQTLVAIRCMHFARDIPLPFGGEISSRLIRYIFGMEVHWCADISPGISLIHGNGVVISKLASIKSGCVLFHNVTLGASRDPETHEFGAPAIERNVHIGPGATLLGPIKIGEGTKIMAGSVLSHSVSPGSVVKPAKPSVSRRSSSSSSDVH